MRKIQLFALTTLLVIVGITFPAFAQDNPLNKPNVKPQTALGWLVDGNQRYVQDKLLHPNRTLESRMAVKSTQSPFAIILGCSDSRVSPEILFDQGVGDIFVVRVAGNVPGPIELDSIDYSALYLGSSIIMVLGHENCGAINAVLNHNTKDIEAVANLIQPAIKASANMPGNKVVNATKANVHLIVEYLKKSPIISKLINEGKIDVVGGYYHLETGKVELIN